MNVIDELKIVLGLDSSGVQKGMKQAENSISSGISSITAKLGALSAAITAAFSLGAAFGEYTKTADAMGKLADAIDVDISKMHAWSEAAIRAGGSAEGFQSSLEQMSGQLARIALTGTSRMKKIFEGAGIDAGELGRQRDAFEVMMDLAEKAETMSKAEFFGLGRSLGLDRGTIMLLQQGRVALKEAIQLQKELGVYTKEDARITADFNDRMADLKQAFQSFAAIIFRVVLPPFTAFVKAISNFISYLRKHETFVKAFFIGIATVITAILLPAFVSLAAAILANPITWAVVAFAALAAVIEDLVVWAEGGESAFGELWEAIFGSPEEAQETWENLKETISKVFNFVVTETQNLIKDFKQIAKVISETVSNLCNTIISTFAKAFNWIINAWNSVASVLGMTKINVHANIDAAQVTAADATHGGAGASIDNSTHTVTLQPTYNVQANDTAGVMNEIENYNDGLAAQADGAY